MSIPDSWFRIVPPRCDICGRRAIWQHPYGGLRCGQCPRPDDKKTEGGK